MLIKRTLRTIGLITVINLTNVVSSYLDSRPTHPLLSLTVRVKTLDIGTYRVYLFFANRLLVYVLI